MNKYLTYIIGISCILIVGVISYHFVFYIPHKDFLVAQQECEKLANDRYDMETYQFLSNQTSYVSDLKFTYSKQNNQCVYYSKSGPGQEKHELLFDLFTNKTIIFYTEDSGKIYGNKADFNKVYSSYFTK